MGRLLVHITCGPEAPTRAALGLLVSRAAVEEGHEVNVFLAGDAVQLVRDAVLDSLAGLVTGVTEGVADDVVAGGGRFLVSGMSSKARGVTDAALNGKPAEFTSTGAAAAHLNQAVRPRHRACITRGMRQCGRFAAFQPPTVTGFTGRTCNRRG